MPFEVIQKDQGIVPLSGIEGRRKHTVGLLKCEKYISPECRFENDVSPSSTDMKQSVPSKFVIPTQRTTGTLSTAIKYFQEHFVGWMADGNTWHDISPSSADFGVYH